MKNHTSFAAGICNMSVAVVSLINTGVIALFAIVAFAMSFTLFFMAAIPLFLLFGFLFLVSAGTNILNFIVGIGSIIHGVNGGKYSSALNVAAIVIDGLFVSVNSVFVLFGAIACVSGEDARWLGILVLTVGLLSVVLAGAGFILNAISLSRNTKTAAKTL